MHPSSYREKGGGHPKTAISENKYEEDIKTTTKNSSMEARYKARDSRQQPRRISINKQLTSYDTGKPPAFARG